MTDFAQPRLTTLEPIVCTLVTLEWTGNTFVLEERHRHVGGLFSDCGPSRYQYLSRGELQDVLAVLGDQLGRPGPH